MGSGPNFRSQGKSGPDPIFLRGALAEGAERGDGAVDARRVDVEVRDQAQPRRGQHDDAVLRQVLHEPGRGLQEHHVRLRRLGADPARQALCVGVVLRQALDVVLERVQARGGENPGLPHHAAEDLARAPRPGNEILRTHQHRAGGRAQALGEARRYRVEAAAELLHRHAEFHRGVADARAVEVRRQAAALGERERLVEVAARNDPPGDGVLQREQARARKVRVVGLDGGLDVGQIERAVGPVDDGLRLDRAEHRAATRLVAVGVCLHPHQHFVAALAVAHQRREVRLRARGEEERLLEAEELRRALLQPVHGGVIAEHVVADLGPGHRPAHAGRGPRDRVAAQIHPHIRTGACSHPCLLLIHSPLAGPEGPHHFPEETMITKQKLALAALVAGAFAALPAASQTTLTYSSWVPPSHHLSVWQVNWANTVEKATSGRVKFQLLPKHPSSPPGTFDAVRDGLMDLSYVTASYTPARHVLPLMPELPGAGNTAEINSVAYSRIHWKHFHKVGEYNGVKLLAVWTHGPGQMFTKKPVKSLAEFKNQKIRTGGGIAEA